MTTTGERERFEKWANATIGRTYYSAEPGRSFDYEDSHTRVAWLAWQAAIAAQPAQEREQAWIDGYAAGVAFEQPAAQPERAREPVAQEVCELLMREYEAAPGLPLSQCSSGDLDRWTDFLCCAGKNLQMAVDYCAAPIATLPEQISAPTLDDRLPRPSQEGGAGSGATLPDGDTR